MWLGVWECVAGSVGVYGWECGSVWLGVWECVLECGSVWLGVWEYGLVVSKCVAGSVNVCGCSCLAHQYAAVCQPRDLQVRDTTSKNFAIMWWCCAMMWWYYGMYLSPAVPTTTL